MINHILHRCSGWIILLSLFIVSSCNTKEEKATVIIEGTVTGLPDGKLYLAMASKWREPLDSAESKNGHFRFALPLEENFIPFTAAIHFWDKTNPAKPNRLIFRNHTLGADSLIYLRDIFFAEKGSIRIEGVFGQSPYLRIWAGSETELLFKNQPADIGWMGDADTALRSKKMETLKKEIAASPGSWFLLQSIEASKEQYSEKEIAGLLEMFNPIVKKSATANKLRSYLQKRNDEGAPYPMLALSSPGRQQVQVMDTAAKINMLVFWASWCQPCRREIPELKKLQKEYGANGLRIINISIDEANAEWQEALKKEEMNWQQVIIPTEQITGVQQLFNFTTIPFVVFTDNSRKEIARFADYDPERLPVYKKLIEKYLN